MAQFFQNQNANPHRPSFSQTWFSSTIIRAQKTRNASKKPLIYNIVLFLNQPSHWALWQTALALFTVISTTWWLWSPWPIFAQYMLVITATLQVYDFAIVYYCKKTNRSTSSVRMQLIVLAIPRGIFFSISTAILLFGVSSVETSFQIFCVSQLIITYTYTQGILFEPFMLQLHKHTVNPSKWPEETPPLKILHLTDLHLEDMTLREHKVLDVIRENQADLIVLTGDYLDLSCLENPSSHKAFRTLLSQIDAPLGVYATLGSPLVDERELLERLFEGLHIQVIRDQVAMFTLPHSETQIALIGADCDHDLSLDLPTVENLLSLVPEDAIRILLFHSPELMPDIQKHHIDLYLCGHTHGGQFCLPWYGALAVSSSTGTRYQSGFYHEQNTRMYVSRGIGMEGLGSPRIRFFCRPEVTLFTLQHGSRTESQVSF